MGVFHKKRLPVILQAEDAECGLAAVGMVAAYWGKDYDLPALRRKFPISMQGAMLNDLIRIAQNLGLSTRALKGELGALRQVSLPCILHWEFNHFVVLSKIGKDHVIIHDPAVGERKITLPELSNSFTGVILECKPDQEFKKETRKSRIKLGEFFQQINGLGVPLAQIVAFSIIIELIAVVTPFFTQLAIDDVVPTNDAELLKVLALGFGVVFALGPFVTWLRQRLIIYISTQFSAQLVGNMVRYLFSLPLPYFEKRSIGDLLTRLKATDELRELLAEGIVTVLIDGVLALVTLTVMFLYSTKLAIIVLIATVLFITLRVAYIPHFKMLVNETLQKQGREQAELIESLHGVMSIKFAQREMERESIWNNLYTGFINTSARLQATQANYTMLYSIIMNITLVILVYTGIKLVMDPTSGFTLGAFFAFATYRDLFFSRASSLLDQLLQFSMSRVHLERLSEIISEEPEKEPSEYFRYSPEEINLELHSVGYRYDGIKEHIFHSVNAQIKNGDRVMIFGPSGTGKTTLLKVLCGVYPASEGMVKLNGTDVQPVGLRYLRSNVAAVLQSDYLFKGSIIENITFFDRIPDFERAMYCAKMACVHDEIARLPMSYETLIGEMGSSLSQGQQQRVLLARALYQEKPILVMDEGTAHLDEENEQTVLNNLKELGVIIIMTAHKNALASYGTQVWKVERDGTLAISDGPN